MEFYSIFCRGDSDEQSATRALAQMPELIDVRDFWGYTVLHWASEERISQAHDAAARSKPSQ